MSKPYQRKPGDLEIRILADGRLVFVAPDEAMMELAQSLERKNREEQERQSDGRGKTDRDC